MIERRSEIPTSSEDFLDSFVRPRRPVLFSLDKQQKEKKRPNPSEQRDRGGRKGDTATDDARSDDSSDAGSEEEQTPAAPATPATTLPSGSEPPGAATLDRAFGWHTARWESDEYLETVAGDLEVAVETPITNDPSASFGREVRHLRLRFREMLAASRNPSGPRFYLNLQDAIRPESDTYR